MIFEPMAAGAAIEAVCILVGVDIPDPGSLTISGWGRCLTEKDAHAYPLALKDANTVVLIIGDKAQPEDIQTAVNAIEKHVILAECFSILGEKNSFMLERLLKISAVLHMEKDDLDLLVHKHILGQFLGFVNCDNGWVRLDKADLRTVINTGHLGRFKLVTAHGRNKISDIYEQLQTGFPLQEVRGLILYLVSGVETDLSEIDQIFSGFPQYLSSNTHVLFGVGIEESADTTDSASCFLLY